MRDRAEIDIQGPEGQHIRGQADPCTEGPEGQLTMAQAAQLIRVQEAPVFAAPAVLVTRDPEEVDTVRVFAVNLRRGSQLFKPIENSDVALFGNVVGDSVAGQHGC
jgi:hypothetical protein